MAFAPKEAVKAIFRIHDASAGSSTVTLWVSSIARRTVD